MLTSFVCHCNVTQLHKLLVITEILTLGILLAGHLPQIIPNYVQSNLQLSWLHRHFDIIYDLNSQKGKT